jgi:hypothetical protein
MGSRNPVALLDDCGHITGKPEVMPPGWRVAPDKRASKNRCIADDKPTSQA